MATCNLACFTSGIGTYPLGCEEQSNIRKGGIPNIMLLRCDATVTDLTDDAEWAALKTAGQLIVLPEGSGKLLKPETKKEKISACKPEIVIDEVSGLEFVIKQFDNTTYQDFDVENDLKNKLGQYNLLWYGCDGLLYYRHNWATGENPGFDDVVAEVFRESEEGSIQKLTATINFNTYKVGIKGIKLTTAVYNAIFN